MKTGRELADLMAQADNAALNVDALIRLIEETAWSMVNHIIDGHVCTIDDNARMSALHTAALMARQDFAVIQQAVSEGAQFITIRASGGQHDEAA